MAEQASRALRRPALAESAARRASGLAPELMAIRILPPRARFSLRLDAATLPGGGLVAGFALGMGINRRTTSERGAAMRLGPDEWLLSGLEGETARIARDVEAALAGRHFSFVDVSHRFVAFAVSGARCADTLNAGCPLDLSQALFRAGSATRTLLGKCEIVLAKIEDDGPTFEIECGRSFAAYLHDFLLEAARELRAQA